MATCPSGHESADDDFCDVCGFAIGPVGSPSTIPALGLASGQSAPASAAASAAAVPCPQCGVPRAGQFCESCGYDFSRPADHAAPPVTRVEPAPAPPSARPMVTSVEPAAARPPSQPSAPLSGLPSASSYARPPLSPEAPLSSEPSMSSPASSLASPPVPPMPSAGPVSSVASVPPAPATVPPVSTSQAWPSSGSPAPGSPSPASPSPDGAAWTAVVTADRAYYDSVQANGGPGAEGIGFPVYCPQRRFRLDGAEVRVGRRSAHSGIDPEIDLTGPPADPGVSRLHAVLLRGGDGSWSVIDPGSANGTQVNGAEIARDEVVPLRDGDRIHLGAWTELRIITER